MNAIPTNIGVSRRPVMLWLVTGCVLIACMVMIGGITRLTGSGLSITEWKPIMGALPPMNESEWNEAFDRYKRIPEYELVNSHMDLRDFKGIFFWEYLHRNWGRLLGLVFLVPFLVFWRRGALKGWVMRRSLVILAAGGGVGALGWFMVMSGLETDPDVSHYRLAIHLCAAFAVFALVLWTVFDLQLGRRRFTSGTVTGRWMRAVLVLLALQIVWGAFTAGLDAGRIYNTWPLMNGALMPDNVRAYGSFWQDFAGHKDGVQWVHRNLAWLVAAITLIGAFLLRRERRTAGIGTALAVAVLLQFVLGVFTVLHQVPLMLGLMHQLGALLLLVAVVRALHATGVPSAS